MSSSGKYPGNGASLEDCHTNIFALADLNGLKWKAFGYYNHQDHYQASSASVNPEKLLECGDAWSALTDPLLTSYVKCLSAGVLAVWRLKPNPGDAHTLPHEAGVGARARSVNFFYRQARELWIFWHGDDPDFVDLLSPELTNFESGTWDNGIAYECRTLLFKSFHNVIERYLIMHGFIRLGKWFLEPHVYDKNLENRKHLAFSFSFFLHGESAICTSLDIKQLPAIYRLDNKLLGISQNASQSMKVILSPFALSGILTGKSFKENDPGIRDLILGWDARYPYSYHKPKNGDVVETQGGAGEGSTNIPKVLEVCTGGFTMSYPACHIFVAEGDNDISESEGKTSRYSIASEVVPKAPLAPLAPKPGSEPTGLVNCYPTRPSFWTAGGHNSNYGQLSPPESPLAMNNAVAMEKGSNYGGQEEPSCHSVKNSIENGLTPLTELSWASSLGVDYTLASTATQQNFCTKCLDCELGAMDKTPPKSDDAEYRWNFQNPGSFRLCECPKSTLGQCQNDKAFVATSVSSHCFSKRPYKPRLTTTKAQFDLRPRARPYNSFGPSGDGLAAFHKRRRPSVTYVALHHSNARPEAMPTTTQFNHRTDPPAPSDKNSTSCGGLTNQTPRPEHFLSNLDRPGSFKLPRAPTADFTGAATFKETLLKGTLLDIVHKRQQMHVRPPFNNIATNSNSNHTEGGIVNFEHFYVPLGRGSGQLISNVPPLLANPKNDSTPQAIIPLRRDEAVGNSELTMVHDSLGRDNNHNLAQLMAQQPTQQSSHENSSRSLEERMFDPYEFNDDFNHPNPNKARQRSGGGANSSNSIPITMPPAQAPLMPPRYSAQKNTGTGSISGDTVVSAQPYGTVKIEIKEEPSPVVYEQNIFHSLNQYSNSLSSQIETLPMGIKDPSYPTQETEDLKKWDGSQQGAPCSKALSLSLTFNNNQALGSVSLNTLLGAAPINPGILTSSDLSRIFPTPPSLENNNLYSPCGNIAVPPPLGSAPPLDASSSSISAPGAGVCQSIGALDSTSPASGQMIHNAAHTTQPELPGNTEYNHTFDETFHVVQKHQLKPQTAHPANATDPSLTNNDLFSSFDLLKKSLDPSSLTYTAPPSRLEWFRKKIGLRSPRSTSALQHKLDRLNAIVDQYYVESNSSNKGENEYVDANGSSPKSFRPLTLQPEPVAEPSNPVSALLKYVPATSSTTNHELSKLKCNYPEKTSNGLSDVNGPYSLDKTRRGFKTDTTKDFLYGGGAVAKGASSSGVNSSSLLVNLILSSSLAPGINYFPDTNFDACPLCVCNMTIRDDLARDRLNQLSTSPLTLLDDLLDPSLTRNFPALAGLFKEFPPKLTGQQHSHNCMCGFNGAVNRIKAFGAGLFYEDEMEITNTPGPKSLFALFHLTPPPLPQSSNSTKIFNNAKCHGEQAAPTNKSLHSEGNRGADPYAPQTRREDLLELAHSQTALCPTAEPLFSLVNQPTTCDRPETIVRARPYYYNARLYLDQCKIGLTALAIASGSFGDNGIAQFLDAKGQQAGHKLGWRSALNLLFTMHLWPHYQNSENLSSEDTLVTLRSLRPLIQDAILKKGGVRSCLFEHAYNISGPLTWQQFHKLTGRGNEERCEPQPLPLILTGYEHERLSLSPLAINFWEYLHLEPYSLPKDVAYVAIIPDDECLIALANTFFENLNATYEVCKLGRHLPLSRLRDGILKVGANLAKSFPDDNTLNDWNSSFGNSWWEKKLKLYVLAIKNQLGPLLATAPLSLNIPVVSSSTTTHTHSNTQFECGTPENNAIAGSNALAGQVNRLPAQHQQGYASQNGYAPGGHLNQHPEEVALKYGQPYAEPPDSETTNNYNTSSSSTAPHTPLDQSNNATATACNSNNNPPSGTGDNNNSDSLSIVLYLLDPFSMIPPHGSFSNNQDSSSAGTPFSKHFTLGLTKAYTEMTRNLPDDIKRKITLKILPLQTLIQAGNSRFEKGDGRQSSHVSNHFRSFALSLYSQIRYAVPREKPSQSYTGFGPGVHKNSILQKNQASGYHHTTSPTLYAPPYVLAPQQNGLPDYGHLLGRKPKTTHNHAQSMMHHNHGFGSKTNGMPNPSRAARETSAVLFCGYCLSHDQKWLLATATDDRGQILEACFINMDTPNRFRKKKGALQRAVLKKVWDFVVKTVSGTNTMWRITIGRFGRIGHGELKVWSSLLSKRNLQRCNAELRDSCRACSIVPLSAQTPTTAEPVGQKVSAPGVAILSACLISLDLNTNFHVMANSVAPELDRMGYSKLCPLTTPKDVSCTHILVFPLSATAQPSGTDNREEDVAMEELVGGGRGPAPLNHFSLGGGATAHDPHDPHNLLLDDVIAPNPRNSTGVEGGSRCLGGEDDPVGGDDDDDDLLLLNAFSDLPIDQFMIDVDDVMMMEEDGGGGGADDSTTGLHVVDNHHGNHHHHGNQQHHVMMASSSTNHAKPTSSLQHRSGGSGLIGQSGACSNHVTPFQNGSLAMERRKRHSGLEYSDEPIMLLQQPLALGYYVSTAKIGPLPYWFYSANHFVACENRPSFLNAALHINCASVIHSNDDLFSHTSFKNDHKNHPLDSDQTTDILRYVLEGYNRLSWLVMDPSSRDRVSCLPLHLQILLNIYHMLATYS